ncbi:hypothetical protein C488_03983 [Natrinema pellirubrum DSM 15624]|uniref:DUF502 domain-containing protein n=1 Tax=Natrinema pellirubrum (strain DSM 15624 / CIP 106293 / JCM 10476 / NCIMB 786 / 157) TaxID=797303 RepID=L0JIM1_NATP1|nr:DUF502 domain-containing protein [Natrinema pellirubrum]AGB30698.1 hypothetical protein Natpe_0779 [Natrinema pellirubrum DSM 15624]ELY80378.1 hypothetical protein C488_03983 [Natrinema pellirubrum DSM 15624]
MAWKREFASGLIVIGPILVTLYVLYRVYALIAGITPPVPTDALLTGLIAHEQTRTVAVGVSQAIVPLALFCLVTVVVGFLTRTTVGDLFTRGVDHAANRVPGLRVIYNASKVAAETTFGEEQALQEPVRVENWNGVEVPAFKTGHTTPDGRPVLFIPTAPNISSGFVVEADPDRVTETDERVDETLAHVLSAGFGESTRPDGAAPTVPFETTDDRAEDD